MKKNLFMTVGIGAWAALSVMFTGFFNADFRGNFREFRHYCRAEDGRRNLGVAAFFGAVPITWVVSPFMTGFYQYGWTLEHGAWGICAEQERR
jgi:hypothetical protein